MDKQPTQPIWAHLAERLGQALRVNLTRDIYIDVLATLSSRSVGSSPTPTKSEGDSNVNQQE